MDYFTKCNPPPTSCILCLLLTAFLSRYHVLHQHNMIQTTNGELLFSSTLIFRFIVSLRPWPLQTSPIRLLARRRKHKKKLLRLQFSPFHVKTAQLPTIDKCKEQHRAGSEGEGGSLGICSCRFCCIPILSE